MRKPYAEEIPKAQSEGDPKGLGNVSPSVRALKDLVEQTPRLGGGFKQLRGELPSRWQGRPS